ncbi:MAG: septal ring lytic transglycosylase RlpA family protein [Bacteroidales bacterium]|nr:septal ring lytic transglycosylase RlpA family protein [Bacteroidales bacterium]
MVILALRMQAQSDTSAAVSDSISASLTSSMLGTYYADKFVGRRTSNGEIFRQNQYTAAHRTYAFGTYLLVTYPSTGLSIVVKVNDRCPRSNVLDMTKIAVHSLGIKGSGRVTATVLDPETGRTLWANQDTTWMSRDEYLAFRDRSSSHRISPYPLNRNEGPSKPESNPARPAKPQQKITNNKELIVNKKEEIVVKEDTIEVQRDTVEVDPRPIGPRYDIELCTVVSQNVANLEVGRLPKEFLDKVVFERNDKNREVRIILELAETRSKAVRTQAMLIELFPDLCLIPHVTP